MLLYQPAVPLYNVYLKELGIYVLTGSVRTVFASERELCECPSAGGMVCHSWDVVTLSAVPPAAERHRAHTVWVDSSASWERENPGPKGHRLYDVCRTHLDDMQAQAEPWRLKTPGLVGLGPGVTELFSILPVAVVARLDDCENSAVG